MPSPKPWKIFGSRRAGARLVSGRDKGGRGDPALAAGSPRDGREPGRAAAGGLRRAGRADGGSRLPGSDGCQWAHHGAAVLLGAAVLPHQGGE